MIQRRLGLRYANHYEMKQYEVRTSRRDEQDSQASGALIWLPL